MVRDLALVMLGVALLFSALTIRNLRIAIMALHRRVAELEAAARHGPYAGRL